MFTKKDVLSLGIGIGFLTVATLAVIGLVCADNDRDTCQKEEDSKRIAELQKQIEELQNK